MNRYLLILLFYALFIDVFSQSSNFNIEANYPFPMGENFIGKNYDGFADVGIEYQCKNFQTVILGASINASLLNYNFKIQDEFADLYNYKVRAYVIQPRIKAGYNIRSLENFHPSIGLGYSIIFFNISGPDPLDFSNESETDTQSGININLAGAYDLSERIYFKVQYDFVKLGKDNDIPDTPYNTNIHLLKVGLGFRL